MYPFDFPEDDVVWEIVKKYKLLQSGVREAVLAWAYTYARDKEKGETWDKLNQAFKAFRRETLNVDKDKFREIYHLD